MDLGCRLLHPRRQGRSEIQGLRGKVGDRNVPAPLSLFFDDLLDANPPSPRGYGVAKVREFNPRYAESKGALLGQFRHLHTDIYGNRQFVEHLRNRGKFFDHEETCERHILEQAV